MVISERRITTGIPPAGGLAPHSSPGALVGRADELALLRAAFEDARSGRPTMVMLIGEAGIGKTRLADEAAQLARSAHMQVLRGEADAASREPMELWRAVFRTIGLTSSGDPSLPAEERRWERLESLADALISAAPAVVILEDLQWADPIAIWVLEHLPRVLGDAPVALLATSRDREPDMPRLDALLRVSRLIGLGGLDVEAVRQLVAAQAAGPDAAGSVDAVALRARTGGNPLFVQQLIRSPDGADVIGEMLERSLSRFDPDTRQLLATAAVAGAGTPLAVISAAASISTPKAIESLAPALRGGVLNEVGPTGVRFHHALLAEAAERTSDQPELHNRLAAAWQTVDSIDGRVAAAGHRLKATTDPPGIAKAVRTACEVAAELVEVGQQPRAAGLLWQAWRAAEDCVDRPQLRANVAVDLAETLTWLGDLEPALTLYQEAAELARQSSDPVTMARAEIGANLWANAFVPDLPRMRRLEEVLAVLPPEQVELRTKLLGRLTTVGIADVEATEQVRSWAEEAVALARSTADPVLIAQSLLDQIPPATSRPAVDATLVAADEVIRLAERVGRSDLVLSGQQRRAGHLLNHGDIGGASQSLGRAEVLAALLPSPWWRYSTLLQRTTLHALSGSRSAAMASMNDGIQLGTGRVEPVVVLGCEALHRLMLLDLYGYSDERTEEIHRITMDMLKDVPSPVFQVQKGFGAQLFGEQPDVQDMLHRFGSRPELLLRSRTGDQLLRDFADTVARAGAHAYARAAYRTLLPYAGLLNVSGGHSAGLPVDDVLGRLAALDGDIPTAVRHARDAVALTRSMPSPPLLVHCLDHLADAIERAGDADTKALRAEADALADDIGVLRPGHRTTTSDVAPGPPTTASMQHEGPSWIFESPLGNARLPDSLGFGQLARLLAAPGVEVSALELAGHTNAPTATDLGPGLDAQAKREYRQRLHALQVVMDNAEAAGDLARAEHAQVEMEALLRELKRAVGIGGRDRPTGSDAERARVNVARSIRRSIAALTDQAPLLGAHLEAAVRTGRYCIYLPEPSTNMSWTVKEAIPGTVH
ncbi:MAG: AAA family ATPase [Nakamurella sp.]